MKTDANLTKEFSPIISAHLGKKIKETSFIGGGSFGKVYLCTTAENEKLIVKAYYVKGMEKAEKQQLSILRENTDAPMPEVYFTHSDEKNTLLCMSFIEGKNALEMPFLLKSKRQKADFASAVVDGMLQWHNVKGEKFGYLENPCYDSWKEFYIENKAAQDIEKLRELSQKGKFPKKSLQLLEKGFEIFKNVVQEPEAPVLIHGDLNIMNIMADPSDMKLTGFIDPCGSMWADREYDLFQLRNMWGDAYGIYEQYKKKHPVSEHCDFKVAFYGALHENSMRLKGGITVPLWEIQNNLRLRKAMKEYL